MPIPTSLADLSLTAGNNFPTGGENPTVVDDYLRTHAAFLATLRDGKGSSGEVDVASAATCDIGAANSHFVRITGTTGITSFGTNYNGPRFLRFAGALSLANSSTLVLPGGANITTTAGDTCIAVPISGGWVVCSYEFASPQTAQDVTSSRSLGTTYTNSTGRTIYVTVAMQTTSSVASTISATVGSVSGILGSTASASNFASSVSFAVPPGVTYSAVASGGSATLSKWLEIR